MLARPNKTILIIDGDVTARILIQRYLEKCDYEILEASNGEEALEQIKIKKPDLVLHDGMMPGMTGQQFHETLGKVEGQIGEIPIVLMSSREEMKDLFKSWSVASFLKKPFTKDQLKEVILNALNKNQGESIVERVEKKVTLIPRSNNLALISGMDDDAIEAIKGFLESQSFIVETGLDEAEVLRIASEKKPLFILCQFWEEPEMFDAVLMSKKLNEDNQTKGIPFAVFFIPALATDAAKSFAPGRMISYTGKRDLLRKLQMLVRTFIALDEAMKNAA